MTVRIKNIRQEKDWWCGPATLEALLASRGINIAQRKLAGKLRTTKSRGTSNREISKFLLREGFSPEEREFATWRTLRALLAEKKSIVVGWYYDYQKPAEYHFSAVSRVDNKSIVLMDPEAGGTVRIARKEFLKRWHDYDSRRKKKLTRWLVAF